MQKQTSNSPSPNLITYSSGIKGLAEEKNVPSFRDKMLVASVSIVMHKIPEKFAKHMKRQEKKMHQKKEKN